MDEILFMFTLETNIALSNNNKVIHTFTTKYGICHGFLRSVSGNHIAV